MKILSIMCVKNEGDIIEECLREASRWSDRIFIYDGASTDGTWEKVQEMANDIVVPSMQDNRVWNDWLRAEIFEKHRHEARDGDWWCRLDADEFYIDNPREFLYRIHPMHHSVWGLNFDYYLTEEHLEAMKDGEAPAGISPLEYLRHYWCKYCEPRFFRYRPGLVWPPRNSAPAHAGLVSPELIRFKHIPYRSPNQITRRLRQRLQSKKDGHDGWFNIVDDDWKKMGFRPAASLHEDKRSGEYNVEYSALPDYRGSAARRVLQWFCHRTGMWP
jgi:glycosyltransferase involved in cell wall biosynthesis